MKLFAFVVLVLVAGCASAPPIQDAARSESAFAHAAYKGETVQLRAPTPGMEAFRIFDRGATGFVSLQVVRANAQRRADEFCGRKGNVADTITESASVPPHILGNWPRIELVFECVPKPAAASSSAGGTASDDPKYTKLVDLKKLLDSGVITQAEFDAEKTKILSQP